jgi:X8 domain
MISLTTQFNVFAGLVETKGDNVLPRPGYSALSSQLAIIQPSSTIISEYTPTFGQPSICHNFTSFDVKDVETNLTTKVTVATNIPSRPYQRLCSCMLQSAKCIVPSNANATFIAQSVKRVCDENKEWCVGMLWNGTSGQFGAFSSCTLPERQSWVLNQFVLAKNDDNVACSSLGGTNSSAQSTLPANECNILLRQAGPAGTGTVTFTPTAMLDEKHAVPTGGHHISSGAKIGLGVGIGLVVLVSIVVAVVMRRKYANSKKKVKEEEDSVTAEYQKAELEDNSGSLQKDPPPEIDSAELQEIGGIETVEKDADNAIYELASPDTLAVELEASQPKSGHKAPL